MLSTDYDEIYWGLDPLDGSDADDDDDSDGLTNLEEINGWYDENSNDIYELGEKDWYQTKHNDSDTDDDNWSDYTKQHPPPRLNSSDPKDPDSTPSGGWG